MRNPSKGFGRCCLEGARSMSSAQQTSDLKTTPLYDLHQELGGKMVPFAGYSLPVQYPLGVLKEHLWVRQSAGLFDVSHMGQIWLRPKAGGSLDDVCLALESLVPQDILGLRVGRQRYAFFTNEAGGLRDDLMVAKTPDASGQDALFLVVNGACKAEDLAHMQAEIGGRVDIEMLDGRALLALQGPAAEAALAAHYPGVVDMTFMQVGHFDGPLGAVFISRSGYSGEDGFEISVAADQAEALARALLAHDAVEPIGLGARDSLRLEAGLCLYGNDLDPSTSPVEADLVWGMQKARKAGGAREGGYPGWSVIAPQLADGPAVKRVGLKPEGRAPLRPPIDLFAVEALSQPIGRVTSGGFGPSAEGPVAMGYVSAQLAQPGQRLYASQRNKAMPVLVAALPFVSQRYKR